MVTPPCTQTKQQNQPQASPVTKIDPGPTQQCWDSAGTGTSCSSPPFSSCAFQGTLSSEPALAAAAGDKVPLLPAAPGGFREASSKPGGNLISFQPNLPQSGAILTEFKTLQTVGSWEESKRFLGCPGIREQLNSPHQKKGDLKQFYPRCDLSQL